MTIQQAEQNIRQALKDYGAHTRQQDILEDVTDAFITRLARDSVEAKQDLRDLFSKSPVWNPELDATIDKVLEIVEDAAQPDFPLYEYIEADYTSRWDSAAYYDWSRYYPSAASKKLDEDFPYQREYDALLEFHTSKELDKIREELGDEWIEYLFESEFGGSFDEVFGDEEEEEI